MNIVIEKVKKREFKRLWIIRINAACKESGIQYSRFIKGLTDSKIEVNRKIIAELAVSSPDAFKKLVDIAKDTIAAKAEKSPAKVRNKKHKLMHNY